MELEPDGETRARAYVAFCMAQEPLDGSARSADARDRIRDFKQPEAIATLPPDLRELWDWHVENQVGFASAPFKEQKRAFMEIQAEEVVPELGIPARAGRRGLEAFHAAGGPLLDWWETQGRRVTANRGRGEAKLGGHDPRPSAAVRFLADEFMPMAERYDRATVEAFGAEPTDFDRRHGSRLLALTPTRALDVAFKVASARVRERRPTFR